MTSRWKSWRDGKAAGRLVLVLSPVYPTFFSKELLFFRVDLARAGFAVDVRDGEGPERHEVDAGDELAGKRGQELPMPAQKPGEDAGHGSVDDVVIGRVRAFKEDGEEDELHDVGDNRQSEGCLHARAG